LRREHHQHLAFDAGIAERHAREMVEIDRPVTGNQRRRWHPFYPFEMKRHGLRSAPPHTLILGGAIHPSQPWRKLTERSLNLLQFLHIPAAVPPRFSTGFQKSVYL